MALNPMFVKMVGEMDQIQDNWKSYQEEVGFEEQALKEVEEQLGVYETLDDLKWSVKGPAGPLTAEHKELKEKYSQVPPQLAIELFKEHKAKLIAEAEAKLKRALRKKRIQAEWRARHPDYWREWRAKRKAPGILLAEEVILAPVVPKPTVFVAEQSNGKAQTSPVL